ncbi:hypothetical protein EJB05_18731 [Eragrostis curvula]|uniref:Neprosin PEP catalytic domain-containing protein n=1 Tax=Eragrostis curvula TaxID=38414 RepID=A0A5J9VMW9_9POAL|nr:hypothetical protein EJB05_18731 [Eragrostis curvula]
MDPLLSMSINESQIIQRSQNKDAPQLDAGATSLYVATHLMDSPSYYGLTVTSDVYGFSIQENERSGILVQINNFGYGTDPSQDGISLGWHVYPALYGDSKTHFFVSWTRDNYQKTGCYNLQCPGYVPEANVSIVPGVAIEEVSDPNGAKRAMIFKVFKVDNSGDWLVHIGLDSEPNLVGRFPKSLFTNLAEEGNNIRLGGFVITRETQLAPMGSGFLCNSTKAASFSNIQLINQNGQTSKVVQNQPTFASDNNTYSVSPISIEGKFTYGGPLLQ